MRVLDVIENRERPARFKMDNLFYNAIGKAKSLYNRKIACHLGKALLLIVFLIVDIVVLKSNNQTLLTFLKVAIGVCIINSCIKCLIKRVGYADNQGNNSFFVYLAEQVGHASQEAISPGDLRSLDLCRSTQIYNQSNRTLVGDPALTDEIRERYERINCNLVVN